MTINKIEKGKELTLNLDGRLDSNTSKILEERIAENFDGKTHVILDFSNLAYLSSAGLRVILAAQKRMNKQGEMVIKNVNETIMEIFEMTGFSDILTIEK